MKTLGKFALAGAALIVLLQLVRPGIPSAPAAAEIQVPPGVRQILDKDCYSCHSNERRLAWFDEIVPAYWLVRYDILTAREHLNFSTLESKPPAAQKAALYEAANMIQFGAMPLPQFVALHPEAKVTPQELIALKTYLAPWSTAVAAGSAPGSVSAEAPRKMNLVAVPAEFNGMRFEPGFEDWKPISFTDRGDNDTFRFVLGNDIAVKAAQSGSISPWPDGTRLAKIAWQQETWPDGLIHPGKFVQVEFMMKDARQYKQTAGWAWGRWRGLDLKPYGQDAKFAGECTSCHLPMHGNDDIYTLPMTAAKVSRDETVNNRAVDLPAGLPYQPLAWNAITLYVDPASHTMAALFGNELAMRAVQARAGAAQPTIYPAGAILALVTWAQRDDPHWFGGRIPDSPRSVEFVEVGALPGASRYRRYEGADMAEQHVTADTSTQRTAFLSQLPAATLP